MPNWIQRLFSYDSGYMPHGHCYLWQPRLVWLHVISDAIIFLAYCTIPLTLVYVIWKRKDLPFSWMFGLFGVFIVACGLTHLMEDINLWEAHYWTGGIIKAVTAFASIGTAVTLVRLIPKVLALPSPAQLREANEALRKSNSEKDQLLVNIGHMQSSLMRTARKAGQADVASNVLHNVGNVLASVNVAAELILDYARGLPVDKLRKAAELMGSQAKLAEFLEKDTRGVKLVSYVSALVDTLEGDKTLLLSEIEGLAKHVEHIKAIVSLQQEHARVVSVAERLVLAEVVEEVMRFENASFSKHEVRTRCECAVLPEIEVDRHKLLQILMNLLSNARHAVLDRPQERRVVLRTRSEGTDKVAIEVEDNGVGILSDNLDRVFVQGFTTKKHGHGFGLHSSACYASELGGSLSVHSEGPGTGARFTLVLPRQPPAAKAVS